MLSHLQRPQACIAGSGIYVPHLLHDLQAVAVVVAAVEAAPRWSYPELIQFE